MLETTMRACVLAAIATMAVGCATGAEDEGYAWIERSGPPGGSATQPAPPEEEELPEGQLGELALLGGNYNGNLGATLDVDVPNARATYFNDATQTQIFLDDGSAYPNTMVILVLPYNLADLDSVQTGNGEHITSCSALQQGPGWEEGAPPVDLRLVNEGGGEFRIEFSAVYSEESIVDGTLYGEIR